MWNLKLLSVNFHILSQNIVFFYSLNGYLPVCGFLMVFVPHLKNGSLNYTDLPNVNTFYYVIFLKIIIITITNKLIWKACKCWEVVKLTGVHKYQFLLESSNFVISYFPWSSRLALSNFEKIFAKCSSPSNLCLSVVLSSKFGVSLKNWPVLLAWQESTSSFPGDNHFCLWSKCFMIAPPFFMQNI